MIYEQIIRIAIGEKGEPLLKVIDSCNEVCLKVISTVMYFTPIGVFCTIVPVVEANGTSTIVSLATQLIILYVAFYGFAFNCVRRCSKISWKDKSVQVFPRDHAGSTECIRNLFKLGNHSDQ